MLKIFRKIRHNMINEGNLKRYLFYAIGEILLVMIGILLALQVNNWNEERKVKKAESRAIINLINEFERNIEDLVRVWNLKLKSERELRKYLQILNSDTLSISYITSLDRPDIGGYTWNPTNPIMNSLLSTGKLDNIKNDSLKSMLTSWNDLVEDYLEQQSIYNQITIPNFFEYENKALPAKVMEGNHDFKHTSEKYISKFDILKSRENIINKMAYHNQLANCINRLYIQVASAKEVIQISNHVLEMLKEEIK